VSSAQLGSRGRHVTPYAEEKKPGRAFLGVHYEMANGGSHVTRVVGDTPASKAGLERGDVITKVDGRTLTTLEDLADYIGKKKAGEKVSLTLRRDGKTKKVNVTLGERDEKMFRQFGNQNMNFNFDFDGNNNFRLRNFNHHNYNATNEDPNRPMLGVTFTRTREVTNINGEETVVENGGELEITDVIDGTAAKNMGLKSGDVITGLNGAKVSSHDELTRMLKGMNAGDEIRVDYLRNGSTGSAKGTLTAAKDVDMKGFGKTRIMKFGGPAGSNVEEYEFHFDGDEDMDANSLMDMVHKKMEEAKARDGGETEIREFRMVITMDEVSAQEAQALSEKSGQQFSSNTDLQVNALQLAPNPSSGKFNVAFDLPTSGNTELQVFDVNGNMVYREEMKDFSGRYKKDFDISDKAKGIYYLQIIQDGKGFSRKIVTQ
ncbi:MAG: PDZ domain-containing protein, partial [Bacteroidota bacterium]